MSAPRIQIDANGQIAASPSAKAKLVDCHGNYTPLFCPSLIVLTHDEGTGATLQSGESFATAGDLKYMNLLGLLNAFAQERETGRLVIKQGREERVIMMRNGDVASVGSNAPRDRIGRFLVRLGKITEAQLEQALSQAGGRRIGQVLLTSGFLDAHELWASIQVQITEIFSDVVQWETGAFVFYRLPEEHRWPSTPPIGLQGLLLESVRRADEMSIFREKLPDNNTILQRSDKPVPDDLDDLTRNAAFAIGDGLSIADLGQKLHLSDFEANRQGYKLLKARLAEIIEEKEETPLPLTQEPFELDPEDAAKMDVFNLAFREIRDEVVRNGQLEAFTVGIMKYLSNPENPHASLFRGIAPDSSGALPAGKLTANLAFLSHADPRVFMLDALNELTFFMLFQCGELLDPTSDENLGRRVRLIHSALSA
ncbi:MAG: DUF4388 domain-containing protein [Deltaproteobacteria bacterium]|nr:DUF4388 domain-containing protein [Deltaproteobacteria bacterium]